MQKIFSWFRVIRYRRVRRRKVSQKSRLEYENYKELARELVMQKLAHWNQYYQFSYGRIAIRSQKTRWGSCSSRKNLNFNYRIVFLEPELQDYLIVHELCHVAEMNHGRSFWMLVEKTIPDYKQRRAILRKTHMHTLKPLSVHVGEKTQW